MNTNNINTVTNNILKHFIWTTEIQKYYRQSNIWLTAAITAQYPSYIFFNVGCNISSPLTTAQLNKSCGMSKGSFRTSRKWFIVRCTSAVTYKNIYWNPFLNIAQYYRFLELCCFSCEFTLFICFSFLSWHQYDHMFYIVTV